MKKGFDCIQIKREGARRLQERLAGMGAEEVAEYWRRRSEEFRAEQERLRRSIENHEDKG